MPPSSLASLREFYGRELAARFGPPKGATPDEIAALEQALGFALPGAYREFLQWMGHDRDGVFCGSDCFIDDVVKNSLALPELLTDNRVSAELPAGVVCWFLHQGYIAYWFISEPGCDDPTVYAFTECDTKPTVHQEERFSQFLEREIRELSAPPDAG